MGVVGCFGCDASAVASSAAASSAAAAVGARQRRDSPPATLLVDQSLEAVRQVARQSLQAGQRTAASAEQTDQRTVREADFARRKVGQRSSILCGQRLVAEHTALDNEVRVGLGEVAKGLGNSSCITLDEGNGRGAGKRFFEVGRSRSRTAKRTRVFL